MANHPNGSAGSHGRRQKPSNPNGTAEGWFYHQDMVAPSVAAHGTDPHGGGGGGENILAPTQYSQEEQAEQNSKKQWVRDTDSDYVIKCKKGGQQDLLKIREPSGKEHEPVQYPRSEWFDHERAAEPEECETRHAPNAPEWYKYDNPLTASDETDYNSMNTKRPMMGYDKLTSKERDEIEEQENCNLKNSRNKPGKHTVNSPKLPPIEITQKHRRQKASVEDSNIGSILSHGYVTPITPKDPSSKYDQNKAKTNLRKKAQDDYAKSQEKQQPEKTKLFKLSKFEKNASPRVDNRPPNAFVDRTT